MKTIYDLTEAERATMLKLIEMKLVVRTGDHAKALLAASEAVHWMEGMAKSLRRNGYEGAAVAADKMIAHVREIIPATV
jgi:hypothetical protein